MEELNVIVYTMKGCPFCQDFKTMLNEKNISYHDRDIDEHSDEYDLFVKVTGSELIPSILVIENDEIFTYVPEKNFNELTEAVILIESHL